MQTQYEAEWRKPAPWSLAAYDNVVYARIIEMLEGRRYPRALEIGSGSGTFTRLFAPLADQVVAIDIAMNAISRARARNSLDNVHFEAVNVMEYNLDRDNPWDLIVFGETIYCLGCYYTFFEVAWLARGLFHCTRPGGRLLLANCQAGDENDDQYALRRWLVRSYRDMFVNVGYVIEAEENLQVPNDYGFETLISVFSKPSVGR